jgi:hypothetical protein
VAFGPRICASCGNTTEIHEHHLVPRVADGEKLPTVWLCVKCHGLVHDRVFPTNHTELTRKGLEAAKSRGVILGRKQAPEAARALAQRLHGNGMTLRAISAELASAGFRSNGKDYGPSSVRCML